MCLCYFACWRTLCPSISYFAKVSAAFPCWPRCWTTIQSPGTNSVVVVLAVVLVVVVVVVVVIGASTIEMVKWWVCITLVQSLDSRPHQGLRNFHFEVDTFYFSTFYRRSSLAHIHCQGHLERITRGACNPDVALCLLSVLNIRRRPNFTHLSFVTYKVSFSGVKRKIKIQIQLYN